MGGFHWGVSTAKTCWSIRYQTTYCLAKIFVGSNGEFEPYLSGNESKIGEMLLQGQGRLNLAMEKEVVCIIVHFLLSYLPMSSSLPYLVLRGAWLEFPHTQKEWEVVFQHIGDTHEIGTSLSLV